MQVVARPDGAQATAVTVCVLGPLHVWVGGAVVEIPGPKRQALLALLAEADGRPVSAERLLDALWPEDPPVSARATLQSHVSRLRAHLGPAADRLEHGPAGYRLALDGRTDAALASSLLAEAGGAEPRRAMELLSNARNLWRGPPLAGLDAGDELAAWSVRLDNLRSAIDSAFVAAAMAAGSVVAAVDVAQTAVAVDPLSERAALDLMRALAASGRVADALRAAYDHRRLVVEETGLEPSNEVSDLESALAGAARTTRPQVVRPPLRLRGRERDIAALQRLLEAERCVTVLGPGGVGKTTLATEVASRIEPATAVRLGVVPPGSDIDAALADALGLRVTRGDVLDACGALLGAGPWLLVLDGCEHVLPSVRRVASHLLAACPELTVAATSRQPLGLAVEQRLRIAPLDLSAPAAADRVDASPAVAMFVDRAHRVDPDLAVGPDELDLIVDIVRRLEGMPLAIELAAGRLSSLGLADLHARLDDALDVLEGGEVALRQTIAWSYDLLPADEQRLLCHLSVFPDGVDIGTAEAIAADVGASPHAALSHLVDASMVARTGGTTTRYRQLDVVRAFAGEALAALGDSEQASARFIRWGMELTGWVDSTIGTADEASADAALRRELANLRAIWTTVRAAGRFDEAVRLVTALSEAAGWRDLTEPWEWMLDLADDPALEGHDLEVAVLGHAAGAAWSRGELERAASLAERGVARGGPSAWRCQAALALVALSRGDLSRAADLGEAAGDAAEHPEQSYGVAALAAAYAGDLARADGLRVKLHATATSPALSAFDDYVAGEIAGIRGDEHAALEHYERAIDTAHRSGATLVEGIASVGRLTSLARAGRTTDALDGFRDLVGYWERTGGWVQQWTTLRNLASLLLALGDERTAVRLALAADAAPDSPPLAPAERDVAIDAAIARGSPVDARSATDANRAQVLEWAYQAIDALAPPHVSDRA
jgi:predicted ATPase/DNA-binding SARP family transcriptional activator